jgi:hypothetical protein
MFLKKLIQLAFLYFPLSFPSLPSFSQYWALNPGVLHRYFYHWAIPQLLIQQEAYIFSCIFLFTFFSYYLMC